MIDISEVEKGNYELFFVFADEFNTCAKRGIQFANVGVYNEELNANKLVDITIK